jgi:hypothetical protein
MSDLEKEKNCIFDMRELFVVNEGGFGRVFIGEKCGR